MRKRIRTQYLIKKKFQLKYVLYLVLVGVLIGSIYAFASQYYINLNLDALIKTGELTSPAAQPLLSLEKQYLFKNLMKVSLILIIALTLGGILITHRIAGPIFALERRMREVIKDVLQGQYHFSPLKIRKTDEFQELIDLYNKVVFSFDAKLSNYVKKFSEIELSLNNLIIQMEEARVSPDQIKKFSDLKNQLYEFKLKEKGNLKKVA